jgi:hypothetical protein
MVHVSQTGLVAAFFGMCEGKRSRDNLASLLK